jgi:hypothetical protein
MAGEMGCEGCFAQCSLAISGELRGIGIHPVSPFTAVNGERRVSSAVMAVGERAEILAPGGSRPRFSPGRDLFASVHSSTCSEMLSASSTSMPR